MASEPQAAAAQQILEWLATQQVADPQDAAEHGSHAGRVACLLWAYDEAVREIRIQQGYYAEMVADNDRLDSLATQLAVDVSNQSKRAREAEARVDHLTAEIAAQITRSAEREQVWARRDLAAWDRMERRTVAAEARAERAESAIGRVRALVEAWRKMAGPADERADDAAVALRRVVASLGDVLDSGPAGQPAGMDGQGCADASDDARLPAGPDPRFMPPEIPLSAIPGMEDGDRATITAQISAVEVQPNDAGAPYAWIVLRGGAGKSSWPVRVSPTGWARYGGHLTEDAVVTAAVTASTDDDGGLVLWLTAAVPAGALDWTAEDETGWAERRADGFPRSAYMPKRWPEPEMQRAHERNSQRLAASPPFRPWPSTTEAQFLAGLEQSRRDIAAADGPVLDPSQPGFSPAHYVMELGRQVAAERDREDGAQ